MEDATSIKAFEYFDDLLVKWLQKWGNTVQMLLNFKRVRPRSCVSEHYPRQGRPWMLNSCTTEMFLNQTSLVWHSPSLKHQWSATAVASHFPAIHKLRAFHFLRKGSHRSFHT